MFDYDTPADKFRPLQFAVCALLLVLFVYVAGVVPLQRWRYDSLHPLSDWGSCTGNGFNYTGDGRHFAVWSATSYSPDRRYLVVYDNPCLYAPWGTQIGILDTKQPITSAYIWTSANFQSLFVMRYGEMALPVWVTNRKLRVTCFDCWPQDVLEARHRAGEVTVEYVFLQPQALRPPQLR